jgi:hypothetical protein
MPINRFTGTTKARFAHQAPANYAKMKQQEKKAEIAEKLEQQAAAAAAGLQVGAEGQALSSEDAKSPAGLRVQEVAQQELDTPVEVTSVEANAEGSKLEPIVHDVEVKMGQPRKMGDYILLANVDANGWPELVIYRAEEGATFPEVQGAAVAIELPSSGDTGGVVAVIYRAPKEGIEEEVVATPPSNVEEATDAPVPVEPPVLPTPEGE